MDMNRKLRTALCTALAVTTMSVAANLSTVSAEWYKTKDGISYTDENGAAKGWKDIDGARYYFGEDGYAVTGLQTIDGRTYYFSGDGRMKTGKLKINGKVYSFGKDGAMKEDASAKTSSAQTVVLPWGMTEKQIADRAEKYKKAGRTVTVEEHEYSRTYKIE